MTESKGHVKCNWENRYK